MAPLDSAVRTGQVATISASFAYTADGTGFAT